jgi:uncharacterized protein
MIINFDAAKSAKNLAERELPFDSVIDFYWQTASIAVDTRNPYPEPRLVAFGYLQERLHVLCFTPINGGIRVISLHRANKREVSRYENP